MHDVVIRGGNILDGNGKPAFDGDVAIADGRIVAVGKDLGSTKKTVDADGLLVYPDFDRKHTNGERNLAQRTFFGARESRFGVCQADGVDQG